MGSFRFPTGDAVFEGGYAVLLRVPKSQDGWALSVFFGMIEAMTRVDAWYPAGETTTDEASEVFDEIMESIQVNIINVGMINWWSAPPSDAWLLCDASLVEQGDYSDLFDAIGTTFNTGGEAPDQFRLPDLRGRTIAMTNNGTGRLPTWADDLGGTGGESSHTLTISEMPMHSHEIPDHTHVNDAHTHTTAPHSHVEGIAVPSLAEVPVAPVPSAVPGVGSTAASGVTLSSDPITIHDQSLTEGTEGDGSAHNNVQPTMALSAWILAKI